MIRSVLAIGLLFCLPLCSFGSPVQSPLLVQAQPTSRGLLKSAQEKVAAKDYQDAIAELDQLILSEPNNSEAFFWRGSAYRVWGYLGLSVTLPRRFGF